MKTQRELWSTFRRELCVAPSIGLRVDLSRLDLEEGFVKSLDAKVDHAFAEMAAVERGDIVNTDEKRRVGHYWLRDSRLAPEPAITQAIDETLAAVKRFAGDVHAGRIAGAGGTFTDLIVVGIGGSSLGPRFVALALGTTADRLRVHFFDNTDPDGFDLIFARIGASLSRTLTVVISKSGGTKETRNGMLAAADRYRAAGLNFGQHAVAVTGEGSELGRHAEAEGFLATFPMWDWVGGRTSELSAVGLLPAALQGFDIDALLEGARACDEVTRRDPRTDGHAATHNPSMALALGWLHETRGRGEKDMVILPYKDRLALLSQYLQQLVMESLGKERDREGKVVHQGIAVYGNKGSTDQHAYVQQLRDGVPNFFVTFIGVLSDFSALGPHEAKQLEVEPGVTPGDYLSGFLLGTRRALYENGRGSITLTLDELSAKSVGMLIALYERAVGFYAALVNVNAYHQPGVEAGKKAAEAVIALERKLFEALRKHPERQHSVEDVAVATGSPDEIETVFHVLEHLASNARIRKFAGKDVFSARYSL